MTVKSSWLKHHGWKWLLAPFLAVGALGFCWQMYQQTNQQNRQCAQLDLDIISDSLKALAVAGPVAMPRAAVTNLDARVLYGLLSANHAGGVFQEHRSDWDRRQELVDPWGQPYQMEWMATLTTESASTISHDVAIKIWSVGPNGRDEEGHGDDITCPPVNIRLRE